MPADAGIRFGHYVLVKRIARGGMAEVFLAQQRGLEGFDRRVAVKRILPHLADSSDFVKMFFGEAKLAAQLAHPNVVHIYEFGKVESDYFIAMEFVDGVHTGQLFKHGEKEKLPATMVARIGADAANALHYAHELRGPTGKLYGLVHRDVSPANIMVSYDGVVKLCDFGIAKAALVGDQLTNPGQVKGKYAYMSPEQTIAAPLDGRSDVFSLAIVLWELLAGRYIVPRGDAVAAMRAIRDGKLEPIEKAAPHTPAPLIKAITWALEPKRDKRATAADLAQALEGFLKAAPELATSMQLGAWIRARFVRDSTGQVPAIPLTGAGAAHPGTQAAPLTLAASVSASPAYSAYSGADSNLPVTPPIYPPRRVVKLVSDTGEGTEIYSASDLEDAAQTIKGARPVVGPPVDADKVFAAISSGSVRSYRAADEPTVHAPPPTFGDDTEFVNSPPVRRPPDEEDSENVFETVQQDTRTPIPSGPTVVPTRTTIPGLPPPGMQQPMRASSPQPLSASNQHPMLGGSSAHAALSGSSSHPMIGSGPQAIPGSGRRPFPGEGQQHRRGTVMSSELDRERRRKLIIGAAGLGGLMLLSFMIALAASGGQNKNQAAQRDAAVDRTDAALPIAPPPIDASTTDPTSPTVPIDAGPEGEAYLEVRTIPDGGTVKVGDQSREAIVRQGAKGPSTAQLVLKAGKHIVTAELAGYEPETREVRIERGEHQKIEIAFTKKLVTHTDRGPPTGRLSVRTTPWSDVYLGTRKLGQAPFADLELPAGTYTLSFKNPSRPTVTKTVKIVAGKSAKLNFSLP